MNHLKDILTFLKVTKLHIDMRCVADPVAFKRRNHHHDDGFSRVVVFIELRNGHYKGCDTFHAVQVEISSYQPFGLYLITSMIMCLPFIIPT